MEVDERAFLQQFSPYELAELSFIVRNSITEDVAMFMTALFAYVGSAYFVGARLHLYQYLFATTAYSIFQFLIVFSIFSLLQYTNHITFVISEIEQSRAVLVTTPILLTFVWIGSLMFSFQVRGKSDA